MANKSWTPHASLYVQIWEEKLRTNTKSIFFKMAFSIFILVYLNKCFNSMYFLFFCFHYRQNFVVVLHAVNQYRIDIFLKSVVVRGMDHVYGVAFVCPRWTVSRLVFYASAKSTVKLITQSKSSFKIYTHTHIFHFHLQAHMLISLLLILIAHDT